MTPAELECLRDMLDCVDAFRDASETERYLARVCKIMMRELAEAHALLDASAKLTGGRDG